VEKLVYGGDGLGREDGKVVLAPFVLPGEEVRLEAAVEKPGMVRARLVEVLRPAPERVPAPCPYFARCGGCHYQHAPYEYQVEAKKAILADQLRRIARIEPPGEIHTVAGEPWNYRNRSQFHLEGREIGYLEARSHRLCPVEICPISSPALNRTLATLREMLPDRRWPRFVRSIEVFTDERQVQVNVVESAQPVARRFFDWCAERIEGWVPEALDYEVDGTVYRVSRRSFFQVNRYLAGRLVDTALEEAAGETALDLYAGVGLFALSMARRFRQVTAVESGASAIGDLAFNAQRAGLAVKAERDDVERYLETLDARPDFVLLDPPRTGIGKNVVRRLADLAPPQVAIVSCDPATLARDLAGLLAAGFRLERLTLVDLFPQTYHMETVARLSKET
jgi:23S rRNA (uracil1939-C5)-methyltransferase